MTIIPGRASDLARSDADNALRRGEAAHRAGDFARAETIYREILEADPAHARALHNLALIALHAGNSAAAERLLKRAIALDPDMAEAHSNLGLALDRLGKCGDARAAFERAVTLRPDYAEAWSNLAIRDQADGDIESAIARFRRAMAAAPERAEIAVNLGAALVEAGAAEEGAAVLELALSRAPRAPVAHFNLAKARFAQGALDEAIAHFRQAIALEPGFAAAHHTLAHALLAAGKLEEGWREYGWRWRAKRFHVPPRDFPIPRWDGESVAGKRVLIWSEQGVGDKLLFAGLLPELARSAAACTLEIEERLVPLFRRSFAGVEVVARRDPPDGSLTPDRFDLQMPLGDLPRLLRPRRADFRPLGRYLTPDPTLTAALRRRYAREGCATVGIAWASRAPKGLPLAGFAPLLTLRGARWVSLQYGDHADEIRSVERQLGVRIECDRAIDPLANFDCSVAQTAALDAVVTIQNATLYVAGALGLPTFALTPPGPDWRWFGRDASPWHESVLLYRRQGKVGTEPALARLAADLAAWLGHFQR